MTDVPITVAQFRADLADGSGPPAGDDWVITDTAANIETLTAAEILRVRGLDIFEIVATDASVALQPIQAAALLYNSIYVAVPPADMVTTVAVSDDLTAAQIEALTGREIASIAASGYTTITVTDAAAALTIVQAEALWSASLNVAVPQGDVISFADTAANIEALTSAQISALYEFEEAGLSAATFTVAATDASVVLTDAEALTLYSVFDSVTVPPNDTVTVADTAANIEAALANADDYFWHRLGVHELAVSGDLTLTLAEVEVLEADSSISVSVTPDDTVILTASIADLQALTQVQWTKLDFFRCHQNEGDRRPYDHAQRRRSAYAQHRTRRCAGQRIGYRRRHVQRSDERHPIALIRGKPGGFCHRRPYFRYYRHCGTNRRAHSRQNFDSTTSCDGNCGDGRLGRIDRGSGFGAGVASLRLTVDLDDSVSLLHTAAKS